jgi:hypothetical protein
MARPRNLTLPAPPSPVDLMNAPSRSPLMRLVPVLAIVAILAGLALRSSPVVPAIVAPIETPVVIVVPVGDLTPIAPEVPAVIGPAKVEPQPDAPACDPPKSTLACTWTYNDATGKAGSVATTLDYQPPKDNRPYPMTWRSKPFTLPHDYAGVAYLGSPEAVPIGASCTITFERLGPEKFNHVISVGTAYPTLPYVVYRIGPDRAECAPLRVLLKHSTGNGRETSPKGYDSFQISEQGHGVD